MDIVDMAQDAEAVFRLTSLARRDVSVTAPAREICVDCDQPIPHARRLAVPGWTRVRKYKCIDVRLNKC